MKKKILYLFYAFTILLSTNNIVAQSNYVYNEEFNNKGSWYTGSDGDKNLSISGGKYYFEHKRTSGSWMVWSSALYLDLNKDFELETSIQKISGVDNYGIGFMYDFKDTDNFSEFTFSANGYGRVAETKDGNYNAIKKWKKISFVKTGNYATNILRVKKKGSYITFYINDSYFYSMKYDQFMGKKMGIVLYRNQKIAINYIKAKYLSSTNTSTTAKNEMIMFDGFFSNRNNWPLDNSDKAFSEIKNGKLFFEYKSTSGGRVTTHYKFIDTNRDFYIKTRLEKINGTQYNGFGLVFARKDNNNQNMFFINSSGSYVINKYVNGTRSYIKNWTKSSAIKTGNGAYNELKVEKAGKALKYYINNTLVYTDYSWQWPGHNTGLIVYDKQKVAMDWISMYYIGNKNQNNNYSTDHLKDYTYSDSNYYFSDQFSNNTNNWSVNNTDDYDFSIKNGKYYIEHKRSTGGWSNNITKYIDTSRDFEIETKIDKISGVTNYSYGLMWGKKDNNSFRFFITSNGYYKIVRFVDNKEQVIKKWATTSYINKENGKSNTLKIKKEGDHYKFYINGYYLTQVDFEPFYGDRIGYLVYNDQKIAVNYLRIKYNSKQNNDYVYSKLIAPVNESFSSNTNKWYLTNADTYTASMNSGKLKIHRTKSGGIFISKDIDIDTSKDFIIETAIARDKNGATGLYGVTFGRKNGANEYSFLLSTNGSYKYRKFENDKYTSIIPFTESDAIKTGIGQNNVIRIVKTGNLLRFFVNGEFLQDTPFEPFFGDKLGFTAYHEQRIAVDYLNVKYQTSSFNNPPIIVITEPKVELERGFKIVKTKKILVKGTATDSDGIYEVKINGIDAQIQEDGSFTANVPLAIGSNKLTVIATDIKQVSATKTFAIKRKSPIVVNDDDVVVINNDKDKDTNVNIGFGKYYALIIGVSDYGNEDIDDLAGLPTKDAADLANILIGNYNFKKENITLLNESPTANDIKKQFAILKKKVTNKDNVIIFYAGHGVYDEKTEIGSWLPSDADPEFGINTISNSEIKDFIKAINSKHTLLISDACFSGSIFKTRSFKAAPKSVQVKYSLPSRKAMTSGTLKTVPNKSVFLKYLIKRLTENPDKYISARQLFNSLEDAVINNSENKPQFGVVGDTGDEGGDFIFVKN